MTGSYDGYGTSVSHRATGPPGKRTAKFKSGAPLRKTSTWTSMEKDLFQKGLDLIGPNWKKLSRFISTKSPSQIKSYHRKWAETANVVQDSTMDDFSVSYVMVPTSPGLDLLLDDPLGILQTATTTVSTTPFDVTVTTAETPTFDEASTSVSCSNVAGASALDTRAFCDIETISENTVPEDICETLVSTIPYNGDTVTLMTTLNEGALSSVDDHFNRDTATDVDVTCTSVEATFSFHNVDRESEAPIPESDRILTRQHSTTTQPSLTLATEAPSKMKKQKLGMASQEEYLGNITQSKFLVSNSPLESSLEDITCGNNCSGSVLLDVNKREKNSSSRSVVQEVAGQSSDSEFTLRENWPCSASVDVLGNTFQEHVDGGPSYIGINSNRFKRDVVGPSLFKKDRKKNGKDYTGKSKCGTVKFLSKKANPLSRDKSIRKVSLKNVNVGSKLKNSASIDGSWLADIDSFAALDGQVIRLVKADVDDDADVDIDVSDSEQLLIKDDNLSQLLGRSQSLNNNVGHAPRNNMCRKLPLEAGEKSHGRSFSSESFSFNSETVVRTEKDQISFTFLKPEREIVFGSLEMSAEEKKIHFEYFSKKGVKTPERYLKIRNAILDIWQQCKPNYLGKTFARKSIKNGGDVNSIGKIHDYLEKKGAINFGCSASKYDTPLIISTIPAKSRHSTKTFASSPRKLDRTNVSRHKKNRLRVGFIEGGGLTISHDDSGAVVDAYHVPETPRQRSSSKYYTNDSSGTKNEQFRLIKCMEYTQSQNPAPYSLTLHPQAAAIMDLHAHSSVAEVMGLVGGYYDPNSGYVHVTVAVPTQATASGFECDMCPVSQAEGCVRVQECGVQVIGWYHSHPTFPANPSLQDIETQAGLQDVFARTNSPFVGIIISPFCPTNRTESSQIQCLVLDEAPGSEFSLGDGRGPYKLDWEVRGEKPNKWTDLEKEVREVVMGEGSRNSINNLALRSCKEVDLGVEWRKEWRVNLTYWEKAIKSLELLLPQHMTYFVPLVKQAFISAIKDRMGDR